MINYNSNNNTASRNVSSSKGNQFKGRLDNIWYKADRLGYEGAAEYLSSDILKSTNVTDFVEYSLETINCNHITYNGCSSKNFLLDNEEIVTVARLFQRKFGTSLEKLLEGKTLKEKVNFFVASCEDITKTHDFGAYLTSLFELDAFILNEDRHFNNIAFIKSPKGYKFAPVFDNGAAFLSDTRDSYPLLNDTIGLCASVEAKPFSKDFDKQVEICRELYGPQLKINNSYEISENVKNNICKMYGETVFNRLKEIFEHQKYLYPEMFVDFNQ